MACLGCFAYFAAGGRAASGSSSTAKGSAAAQKRTAPTKTTRDVPLPHTITAALEKHMQDVIVKAQFDKFSEDGCVNIDQFKGFCKDNEYALEELEMVAAFVKLDVDKSGYIEFTEFQQWCRLQDGRAGHLRFESAAMQWRVSDAVEDFKREVGSRMCMSEVQFANHCCKNGMHLSASELCKKFTSLDKDNDGSVDFPEYLRWRLNDSPFNIDDHYNQGTIDEVASFFQLYEADQTAKLTVAQFAKCHSDLVHRFSSDAVGGWTPPLLETCIQQLDVDGDGLISRHEFLDWWFRFSQPL